MVNLIFSGAENSGTQDNLLRVFYNTRNEIFIDIEMVDCVPSFISLDKKTAIKLSKELRKQISYFEEEVSNG